MIRRSLAGLLMFVGAMIGSAAPAGAHSGSGGVGASNFLTELDGVTPAVEGIEVRVLELGDRIELTNRSGQDVIVIGYEDEPYLRIGPDGVFTNELSAATYVNADRQAETDIPDEVDADAPPRWRRVSDGQTARWHDHRAHWMGSNDPPAAQAEPDETHVIYDPWEIPLEVDGEQALVTGTLTWTPGPAPAPWYGAAAVVGVALVAAIMLLARPRPYILAIATIAVAVLDAIHAVGLALAPGIGSVAFRVVSTIAYPSMGWGAAIASAFYLRRRDWAGVYLSAFAGISVLVIGALSNLPTLARAHVPFEFDPLLARLGVASSLGAGGGVLLSSLLLIWKRRRVPGAVL